MWTAARCTWRRRSTWRTTRAAWSRRAPAFVGGCCGTTPEHIKAMVGFVQSAAPRHAHVTVAPAAAQGVPAVPLAERSRLGAKLAAGEFVTTVEIVPPKGVDPRPDVRAGPLAEGGGRRRRQRAGRPRAQSRMGALLSGLLIEREVGIETVVHYCCRDRNLLGMLSDLLGAAAAGLRNLLIITGDPPKMGPYPDATAVFDIDSIGLTNLVARLNHGLDPGGNAIGAPTRFVIGVGVNPTALELEREMARFAWKVDAGAEYAVTQPVFDLDQLDRFLDRASKTHAFRSWPGSGRSCPFATPSSWPTRCRACRCRRQCWSGCGWRAPGTGSGPRRGGADRPRNAGRGPSARAGGPDRGPARPGAGGAGGPRPSLNALRSSGIFPPDPRPRLAGRNPMTELTTAPLPITTLTEEEEMFRSAVRDFAESEVRPHVHEMDARAAIQSRHHPEVLRARPDGGRDPGAVRRRRRQHLPRRARHRGTGAGGRLRGHLRRRPQHPGQQLRAAVGLSGNPPQVPAEALAAACSAPSRSPSRPRQRRLRPGNEGASGRAITGS